MSEAKIEALPKKESSAKLVVDYAKSGWDDELKRFYSIDDKLSKLLRYILSVLVLLTSFLAWLYVHISEFSYISAIFIIVTSVVSLLALLSAMYQSHKGIQLMDLPRPAMNKALLELLDKENEESAKLIAETYLAAIAMHKDMMKVKEDCFDLSSNEVIFSLCATAITVFLLIILRTT
ncbi:hypothetical protein DET47_104255 [Shewanella putrefaciens]|nr:hypothetical protein DET47_104255 [Shewanella putrefaciens]